MIAPLLEQGHAALRSNDASGVDAVQRRIAELAERQPERRASGSYFTAGDVVDYIVDAVVVASILDRIDPDTQCARIDTNAAITAGASLAQRLIEAAGDATAAERRALRTAVEQTVVFDPTCGAGAFLVGAVRMLGSIAEVCGAEIGPRNIVGTDLSDVAVEACRSTVALELARHLGADPAALIAQLAQQIVVADACAAASPIDMSSVNAIVGNPPYVRARAGAAPANLVTASCGNLSAWVLERVLTAAAPGARWGFVVPLSMVSTDAFQPLREVLAARSPTLWSSHYDTIPSTLFPGVVQRLSILIGQAAQAPADRQRWYTTGMRNWRADERQDLFRSVQYVALPRHTVRGAFAKVGSAVEADLVDRLFRHLPAERLLSRGAGDGNGFWYKRRWSYYLLFLTFMPPVIDADGIERPPTEFKRVDVVPEIDARALLAIYSSGIFYWFFTTFSDSRNVNRRELEAFPVPALSEQDIAALATLSDELMDALRASSEVRTCTYRSIGEIRNVYFRQGETKPVLDRIDAHLAQIYDLTDEQFAIVTRRRSR